MEEEIDGYLNSSPDNEGQDDNTISMQGVVGVGDEAKKQKSRMYSRAHREKQKKKLECAEMQSQLLKKLGKDNKDLLHKNEDLTNQIKLMHENLQSTGIKNNELGSRVEALGQSFQFASEKMNEMHFNHQAEIARLKSEKQELSNQILSISIADQSTHQMLCANCRNTLEGTMASFRHILEVDADCDYSWEIRAKQLEEKNRSLEDQRKQLKEKNKNLKNERKTLFNAINKLTTPGDAIGKK